MVKSVRITIVLLLILRIVYALFGSAFLLYVFSYAPFMGVTVTNFWYSLLFTSIVLILGMVCMLAINQSKRFTNIFLKLLIRFVVSFLIIYITALIMGSIEIVLWLQLVLSLQFALSFLEEN